MLNGYCEIMNRDCVYQGHCIKPEDCYLYEVEKEKEDRKNDGLSYDVTTKITKK